MEIKTISTLGYKFHAIQLWRLRFAVFTKPEQSIRHFRVERTNIGGCVEIGPFQIAWSKVFPYFFGTLADYQERADEYVKTLAVFNGGE